MFKITYDYPVLNNINTDELVNMEIAHIKPRIKNCISSTDDKLSKTALKFIEFPYTAVLRNLIIEIEQGPVLYKIKPSRESASHMRITFHGLGIPIQLADKYTTTIKFNMPFTIIRFGFSKIDIDLFNFLYTGCRYECKINWAAHNGFSVLGSYDDKMFLKIESLYEKKQMPMVYNQIEGLHPYIEYLPKWIHVRNIVKNPSYRADKIISDHRIISIPISRVNQFQKWCDRYNIKTFHEWTPYLINGSLIKSADDQKDDIIIKFKKYNIKYIVS
jgi:hypothetical protein